ncbi:hypothetical protein BZG82_12130, partial [Salinivibrio sp. PR5]
VFQYIIIVRVQIKSNLLLFLALSVTQCKKHYFVTNFPAKQVRSALQLVVFNTKHNGSIT